MGFAGHIRLYLAYGKYVVVEKGPRNSIERRTLRYVSALACSMVSWARRLALSKLNNHSVPQSYPGPQSPWLFSWLPWAVG